MKKGIFIIIACVVMASCKGGTTQSSLTPYDTVVASAIPSQMDLANPASVYCIEQGYQHEIRTATDGSQFGVCLIPNAGECDEWAFYRGECGPASQTATIDETASDGWQIYRNESLGYSFHYPADAHIVVNDDPLKSISVEGPLVAGERWPQFTISHPTDREEYQPPEGVDLATWLEDHYLLGDPRQPDVQIAGRTAIHLRHDRSPQSYAHDRYFFAMSGQLYMIVIGHVGDIEDWQLYNHFLESFRFEVD